MPKRWLICGNGLSSTSGRTAHSHGRLFVRGGVRHSIGIATDQTIYGRVGRIHRHVQLFVVDAIRHEGPDEYLPVT